MAGQATSGQSKRASGDLTLECFAEWLRSQPADAVYCPSNKMRSESCPLAQFSGVQCSPGRMGFLPMPKWGDRFMELFDESIRRSQTQLYALRTLELVESEFGVTP